MQTHQCVVEPILFRHLVFRMDSAKTHSPSYSLLRAIVAHSTVASSHADALSLYLDGDNDEIHALFIEELALAIKSLDTVRSVM